MNVFKVIGYVILLFATISCSKEDDLRTERVKRTVMVYMAANNNLASDAYTNLNQMEEGFGDFDGRLIVYARIFGQQPKIYEIVHDNSPEIKSRVLKTYHDHDSSDLAVMKMVFADMQQHAPSESYAAILWSHATNWAPADWGRIRTRSFGDDEGREMNIQDLKSALPSPLDYLIFDACSMASVEVLYELRHITPYILASPTEVLSVGMPYHRINALLFEDDPQKGLAAIAEAYVNHYMMKTGLEQSASFSLVDTRRLEALANATKNLLQQYPEVASRIDRSGVQRLDLDPSTPIVAYDFLDALAQHFAEEDLTAVQTSLHNAVIYKAHTSHFLGYPINAFCGLSTYIPIPQESALKPFYNKLSWTIDSRYSSFFHW